MSSTDPVAARGPVTRGAGLAALPPAGKPDQPAGDDRRRRRILGVDVARALAIFGMFAVHVRPEDTSGPLGFVFVAPHGRAAILFGLLAGVGTSLLARSRTTSTSQARLKLVWRAALLLPLGLALQHLQHGVLVILADYSLLFLLGVLALTWRDRWLLVLAAASATLGTAGFLWGRIAEPDVFARQPALFNLDAATVLHRLLLSGPYPLITWAAPFLVGMWIGRRDLRDRATRAWLMGAGGALTVVALATSKLLLAMTGAGPDPDGWAQLLVDSPHSQMPLWVVGATGSAAFLLGLSLVVADAVGRVAWPLAAAGQLALTLYVGHLVVLHAAGDALRVGTPGGAVVVIAGFAVFSIVFAMAWRSFARRGPLEYTLHLPWLVSGRVRGRHPSPT